MNLSEKQNEIKRIQNELNQDKWELKNVPNRFLEAASLAISKKEQVLAVLY